MFDLRKSIFSDRLIIPFDNTMSLTKIKNENRVVEQNLSHISSILSLPLEDEYEMKMTLYGESIPVLNDIPSSDTLSDLILDPVYPISNHRNYPKIGKHSMNDYRESSLETMGRKIIRKDDYMEYRSLQKNWREVITKNGYK